MAEFTMVSFNLEVNEGDALLDAGVDGNVPDFGGGVGRLSFGVDASRRVVDLSGTVGDGLLLLLMGMVSGFSLLTPCSFEKELVLEGAGAANDGLGKSGDFEGISGFGRSTTGSSGFDGGIGRVSGFFAGTGGERTFSDKGFCSAGLDTGLAFSISSGLERNPSSFTCCDSVLGSLLLGPLARPFVI